MKGLKLFISFIVFVEVCVFTDCNNNGASQKWGSFTSDITYSYDKKYYALQSVVRAGQQKMIVVSVYSSDTDKLIADFKPARASDFWGICWESDTYNIWIQSADVGVLCYAYQSGEWVLDSYAERPEEIISKYD